MEFYLVLIEEKKDMKICLIKHTLQTHLTFNKPRTWCYYASFAAGLPFRFCFAGVSKTEKRKRYSKISPSTVFSTFDRDQKQKIRQHSWEERFKISKVANFESNLLKTKVDVTRDDS